MGIKLSGMISGMDTDSIIKELMSAQSIKKENIEKNQTKLDWKEEKWKELNTKLLELYKGSLSKAKIQGNYNTKKVSCSDESKVSVTATNSAPKGAHTLEITQMASAQYLTSGKIVRPNDETVAATTKLVDLGMTENMVITIEAAKTATTTEDSNIQKVTIGPETTISDFVTACQDAGLNASFDASQKRLFISSKDSGETQRFTIKGQTPEENAMLAKLGLGEITGNTDVAETAAGNAGGFTLVTAKNAAFILDGASMEEETNNFTVNNMNIDVKGITSAGSPLKITVDNDTDSTYKMVKEFVTGFNNILKEMNELYYADTAKGYDPLTDEEKEAMSDDDVEKWETKIKDSLLRRDSTLGTLITTMKNSLMGQVSIDGTACSLASFGISTSSDYTEKGLLHIYGDEDDGTYSSKDNKLKEMLQSDPELVMKGLSKITQNLYDSMNQKMGNSSISSALTFYNDKEMKTQNTAYKKQISQWEDRLEDMESRYYKQFTAMETALSKLQSQSNSLSSLLGM